MRHFLRSALTIGVLPGGVLARSHKRPLIASASPPERLATPDRCTLTPAVDLSLIAPPADPKLPMATRTVEEPVAALDDRHPSPPQDWTALIDPGILPLSRELPCSR